MAAVNSAERVREYCRQAGINPDNPLYTALLTVVDTAELAREASVEARDAVAGARGLTPEGEAALVQRVGEKAASSVRDTTRSAMQGMRARAFQNTALTTVAAALLLAGVAYYQGHRDGAASVHDTTAGLQAALNAGPAVATAWLQLMRANDPVRALQACQAMSSKPGETRRACLVPMWLDTSENAPPKS